MVDGDGTYAFVILAVESMNLNAILLNLLIFLPLAIAVAMLFLPNGDSKRLQQLAVLTGVVQVVLAVVLLVNWQMNVKGYQAEIAAPWFSVSSGDRMLFSAGYHVGLDGLSLPMVVLSAVVMLLAAILSAKVNSQVKGYFLLFQVLNTAIMGTFAALDMFLFYVFFEFMLIPMYFLIGIWGGPNRSYAAVKFFLYTLFGSILILVAMIILYQSTGEPGTFGISHSFDVEVLTGLKGLLPGSALDPVNPTLWFGLRASTWVFLLLATGFAIKIPAVPLHTWLPDAHVEASTPISVILAALLLKTGAYGLIRFGVLILPTEFQEFQFTLSIVAVVSIIYGSLNALASADLKRMIAYSSVAHMGFVLLGISAGNTVAIQGAIFQMTSHGIISAMLFILAGVIQDRTGSRLIGHYSGLYQKMPGFTSIVLIAFFAAMGIPGFSSFIGELLILIGGFSSTALPGTIPVLATIGILLSAGYLLWTISRMIFGTFHSKVEGDLYDLNKKEWTVLLPLALLTLVLGIYPGPLLDVILPFAEKFSALTSIGASLPLK